MEIEEQLGFMDSLGDGIGCVNHSQQTEVEGGVVMDNMVNGVENVLGFYAAVVELISFIERHSYLLLTPI